MLKWLEMVSMFAQGYPEELRHKILGAALFPLLGAKESLLENLAGYLGLSAVQKEKL